MTTVTIPAPVGEILKTLEAAGYGAWCVGGCVRDALLDRMPGDWDVTTSAGRRRLWPCLPAGLSQLVCATAPSP